MINAATITKKAVDILQADADLMKLGFRATSIERAAYPNTTAERTPWVGVYRQSVDYEPRALGQHAASWSGTIELLLLVQASHGNSGAECEDRLESYIDAIIDALWADPDWNETVDMTTAFSVRYTYDREDSASLYYQQAEISLTLEVTTG